MAREDFPEDSRVQRCVVGPTDTDQIDRVEVPVGKSLEVSRGRTTSVSLDVRRKSPYSGGKRHKVRVSVGTREGLWDL